MSNQIPPIERAIVVLDQLTGALRFGSGGEATGLDVWCDPRPRFSEELRSLEIVLAVPASAAHLVHGGDGFAAAGLQIIALTSAGELPTELAANPKVPTAPRRSSPPTASFVAMLHRPVSILRHIRRSCG